MSEWITLEHPSGQQFSAWHVSAEHQNSIAPLGLVMLPEVYNLNPWARSAAHRFATAGAEVLLLDLYWRTGVDLHFNYDQPEPARALGAAVKDADVIADVNVAVQWLRSNLGPMSRIATLGYCLGGRLSLLARELPDVGGAVSFYGVNLENHLTELTTGRAPSLLHFGDQDPWVPLSTISKLQSVAQLPNSVLDVHLHKGASHGFARIGQPSWHAGADLRAHQSTLNFLHTLPCPACS